MSMESDIESRLESLIDGTSLSLKWAKEEYSEAKDTVNSNVMEDFDDDRIQELALGMVSDEVQHLEQVGGEKMELEVLSIGFRGEFTGWGQDNKTMIYGYGLIRGPIGDNGDVRTAKAVFLIESAHMTPNQVKSTFYAGNTFKSVFSVEESSELDQTYRCWSTGETNPNEDADIDLPESRDEKNGILRQVIPEAKLSSLREDMSSFDPESGYTREFGADLRRIEGRVVDYYQDIEKDSGSYTIMDDSVVPDDVEGSEIMGENQNTPGLTAWADPQYHIEFGRKSVADFYGVVEEGKNGNLQMDLAGVVPIVPMPLEEDESADEDADKQESAI